MRSVNTYYSNLAILKLFIATQKIEDSSQLLIQIFTAKNDQGFIAQMVHEIVELFPKATLIGSTTDGEIMSGRVSVEKTVISFTHFESTHLKSIAVEHKANGFYSGQTVAKELVGEDTKLIIAFADGLRSNGEAFLQGFATINSEVKVAGGLAGDNAKFEQTYVFTKEEILSSGAVAVALNSDRLQVYNDYSFNWHPVGKPLTVTKVKENRLYRIDDKTALETYIHYLGEEMAQGLPAIGIEFPLIFERNGVQVARAILGKHDDGSLTFAGNFKEGERVRFGYGDPKEILSYSQDMFTRVSSHPSEAIFVYSCMARRHFMPDIIQEETLPLHQLAPVAGFFTYGEFYTEKKADLLNQSMTLVVLSENQERRESASLVLPQEKPLAISSIHALINLVNVTSQEAMKQEIIINTQNLFETLFKTSPDGILLIEGDCLVECNEKMITLFGYKSKEELLAHHIRHLMPRRQPDGEASLALVRRMRALAHENETQAFECLAKDAQEREFWTEVMLTPITISARELLYVVCRDISEKKETALELLRQKDTLFHQAYHDELTGLPNRTYFMLELKRLLEEAQTSKERCALAFVDLDRFKEINDSLGHLMGDQVITIIAKRLRLVVNSSDMVARLGGDEFLILLKEVESQEEVMERMEKILSITHEPMFIGNHRLYSSASIGVSFFPDDTHDADNLLKFADAAMYKAKEQGRNRVQFYTQEMTVIAYEHVLMERDLRESMKARDFEVYYQPQVHLKSGKIVGAEALVRWNHPTVGVVPPDIFMPLSIKTGLILELDFWVMHSAMKHFAQWYQKGLSPGVLALNINMKQLESTDFLEQLIEVMEEYQFKYNWLECEVTETEVMRNPINVITILQRLHDLGISIAIDDFGTGYSSLSYLQRLPIDKLKIDQSFIQNIDNDKTAKAIVNTIIVLAKSLDLSVTAEGIESRQQEKFLAEHGCDQVQGFYYAKPLRAKAFEKLLRDQKLMLE
jgi:diguanylate cyclase (GGDEF)-like protein/PAS domain S-box-containing protein